MPNRIRILLSTALVAFSLPMARENPEAVEDIQSSRTLYYSGLTLAIAGPLLAFWGGGNSKLPAPSTPMVDLGFESFMALSLAGIAMGYAAVPLAGAGATRIERAKAELLGEGYSPAPSGWPPYYWGLGLQLAGGLWLASISSPGKVNAAISMVPVSMFAAGYGFHGFALYRFYKAKNLTLEEAESLSARPELRMDGDGSVAAGFQLSLKF